MSELKALDKLCRLSKEVVDMHWGVEFDRAADALEAEVAERYMKLPVDADGVPIHVGDEMETFDCQPQDYSRFTVVGYTSELPGGKGKLMVVDDDVCAEWYGCTIHHVKPRTIEDVLRDCCNEWNEHLGNDWESGVYAKYADEIRELMGGGE